MPVCLCQAINTQPTGSRERENPSRAGFVPFQPLWHQQLLQSDPSTSAPAEPGLALLSSLRSKGNHANRAGAPQPSHFASQEQCQTRAAIVALQVLLAEVEQLLSVKLKNSVFGSPLTALLKNLARPGGLVLCGGNRRQPLPLFPL